MTSEVDSRKRAPDPQGQDQSPRRITNQLIVKLKREFTTSKTARSQMIESLPKESKMVRDFDESGLAVIELPQEADPSVVARALETHPLVDYAEPNYVDKGSKP